MPGCSSRGEDARLAAQPAFEVRAGERVGNLDRDLAAELLVDGEEDRSHAAAADFFDDRVAARTRTPASARAPAGASRPRPTARSVCSLDCSLDLQAEEIARLAAELLVAATQPAQRVERAFAEAAAHLRQVVGHLRRRQPELAGELARSSRPRRERDCSARRG